MSALSDLQAQVAANVDAEASAVTLIQGIAQQLADALAAGPGGQDPALVDLAAKLHASADALAAAVTANTPVVVPPVVTPPVDGGAAADPAPAV